MNLQTNSAMEGKKKQKNKNKNKNKVQMKLYILTLGPQHLVLLEQQVVVYYCSLN